MVIDNVEAKWIVSKSIQILGLPEWQWSNPEEYR